MPPISGWWSARLPMSLLKSVESTIANLVEGAFGRMFRSEVRPMELAQLAREMDEHRTALVSRCTHPTSRLVVRLSARTSPMRDIEEEVIGELCAYLLEHARREEALPALPTAHRLSHRRAAGARGIRHPGRLACLPATAMRPIDQSWPTSTQPDPALRAIGPLDRARARAHSLEDELARGWVGPSNPNRSRNMAKTMIYSTSTRARPDRGGARPPACARAARSGRSASGTGPCGRHSRTEPRLRHRAGTTPGFPPPCNNPSLPRWLDD